MSLSPLIVWAVCFLIISLVGLYISAKTIKIDHDKTGEFIVAMLTILGTLVSILLGLLVSSADDQYRSLESSVDAEASGVTEVFRLARGLPSSTASILRNCCVDYCDKVVTEEWPLMKHGQMSNDVTQMYINLSDAIVEFHPGSQGEAVVQTALLKATSDIGQNRGLRIVA